MTYLDGHDLFVVEKKIMDESVFENKWSADELRAVFKAFDMLHSFLESKRQIERDAYRALIDHFEDQNNDAVC